MEGRCGKRSIPVGIISTLVALSILFTAIPVASAAALYVDLHNPTPTPPYSDWSTAAVSIQDAIDAASSGDLILVANGVYQAGGRLAGTSLLTNRVAVTKPLSIQSVNGSANTMILGAGPPGDNAIRCLYLTNGATLTGFTLTNGFTRQVSLGNAVLDNSGAAVWCEASSAVLSNCVLVGNSAYGFGGGVRGGTLVNCLLHDNAALGGGGAYVATLVGCTITNNSSSNTGGGAFASTVTDSLIAGNWAHYGAGVYNSFVSNCVLSINTTYPGFAWGGGSDRSTLIHCTLTANSATTYGGGVYGGTLRDCTLTANFSGSGGGAYGAALSHCLINSNSASGDGGGANGGSLSNCVVIGNTAAKGGGLESGSAYNCTIVANSASVSGGGMDGGGFASSSIVFYNVAPAYSNYSGKLDSCCSFPVLSGDIHSITNEPLFVNLAGADLRLQSNSPCINAGPGVVAGVDIAGNPRTRGGTVDIGAYEFQSPGSAISYAWLQQYGLPTDGSVDALDSDGDGMTTRQEWSARTVPTNSASALRMLTVADDGSGVRVSWQSVFGLSYTVQRSTNLTLQPFASLGSTFGNAATTTFLDRSRSLSNGPCFYRVRVGTQDNLQ